MIVWTSEEDVAKLPFRDEAITVCDEFVLIPHENGVLIDGLYKLEVLSGAFATSLLPVLLKHINGEKSVQELLGLVSYPQTQHVEMLLRMLISWKLIKYVECADLGKSCHHNTLSYARRLKCESRSETVATTLDTEIIIAHDGFPPSSLTLLATSLADNGFEHVCVMTITNLLLITRLEQALVITLVSDNASIRYTERRIAEHVTSRGGIWFRTYLSVSDSFGELGPMFQPRSVLCLSCLSRSLVKGPQNDSFEDEASLAIWLAFVASEVTTRLLSGCFPQTHYKRLDLGSYKHHKTRWPSSMLCCCCSSPRESRLNTTQDIYFRHLVSHFEERMSLLEEMTDPQNPVTRARKLPANQPLRLNSLRHELPHLSMLLDQPCFTATAGTSGHVSKNITLEKIACLLAMSVGIRSQEDGTLRRWSASGGNLGSVEAYLVVDMLDGIQRGIYMYHAVEHSLVRVNNGRIDHLERARDAMRDKGQSAVSIVLVGSYERLSQKYGAFAFKLLHLDAGVAISQLHVVACSLGLSLNTASYWNPLVLNEALCLQANHDVITHVMTIQAEASKNDAVCGSPESIDQGTTITVPTKWVTELQELSATDIVQRMMSLLLPVTDRFPSSPHKGAYAKRWCGCVKSILHRLHSSETLGSVLNKRRSVRKFAELGPELAQIHGMLRITYAMGNEHGLDIHTTVLVRRCPDAKPGIYDYDRRSQQLQLAGDALTTQDFKVIFTQDWVCSAPVVMCIGSMADFNAGTFMRGYQDTLLQAGIMGHRLSLAAIEIGLCGALVGGIGGGDLIATRKTSHDGIANSLAFACGRAIDSNSGSECI